jgi:hypothetical protein
MRVELKLGLISLIVIGIAASCGGRSGIELGDINDLLDASVDTGSGGMGGGVLEGGKKDVSGEVGSDGDSPDVTQDVTPPKDVNVKDQKDFFDQFPPWLPDSGPIGECVACLQGPCGDAINTCYNDPSCWGGIQCAVPQCFLGGSGGSGGSGSGGQINFQCLLECFDNNMLSLMSALNMFQCITQTCGSVCGLDWLGGGGSAGSQSAMTGWYGSPAAAQPSRGRYIGAIRVPEPEEVCNAYPWLADVLEGRTPEPLPPSARKRK